MTVTKVTGAAACRPLPGYGGSSHGRGLLGWELLPAARAESRQADTGSAGVEGAGRGCKRWWWRSARAAASAGPSPFCTPARRKAASLSLSARYWQW
jgi:hypothetical protein